MRLNFSMSVFRMFGVMNAGRLGPMYMFFMPSESNVSSMQMAFCSYHESINVRGSSFTVQLKASDRAVATLIAL